VVSTDLRVYAESMLCLKSSRCPDTSMPARSGRLDLGHALWALLTLEAFFRQHEW